MVIRTPLFFYNSLRNRQYTTNIKMLKDRHGKRYTTEAAIGSMLADHFKEFFKAKWTLNPPRMDVILEGSILTTEERALLLKEVTDVEIKEAMFSMNGKKSPGPDGFGSLFYKKPWGIMGEDVSLAITDFFNNGKLLKQLNSTILATVPKVKD